MVRKSEQHEERNFEKNLILIYTHPPGFSNRHIKIKNPFHAPIIHTRKNADLSPTACRQATRRLPFEAAPARPPRLPAMPALLVLGGASKPEAQVVVRARRVVAI